MKKLFVITVIFFMLISFAGCTEGSTVKIVVASNTNVSKESDEIEETVPQQTQIAQEEQTEQPQSPRTTEEPKELLPCVAFDLPENIDPLGVFGNENLFIERTELAIIRYDAYPIPIDDLYVINGMEIGGDLKPTITIETEDDNIQRVITAVVGDYGLFFQQMRFVYGDPTEVYYYDEYSNKVNYSADDLDNVEEHSMGGYAYWDMGKYFVEICDAYMGGFLGNVTYIIIGREKVGEDIYLHHLRTDELSLAPRADALELFDPTGIYRDTELFTSDARTILSRYSAMPALNDYNRMIFGECMDQTYCSSGFEIESCPANLYLSYNGDVLFNCGAACPPEDMLIDYVWYCVDVKELTVSEIEKLFSSMSETLQGIMGAPNSNSETSYSWSFIQEGYAPTRFGIGYNANNKIINIVMQPIEQRDETY